MGSFAVTVSAGGIAAADTRVDVAGVVAHTVSIGRTRVSLHNTVEGAAPRFPRADLDCQGAIFGALTARLKVEDLRSSTSFVFVLARALVVGFNTFLILVAAGEANVEVGRVNDAAFVSFLAADVVQEVRRRQVVRGKRTPEAGRGLASAELGRNATLHVLIRSATNKVARLKWMRGEIECWLRDRHEGDDAEDQSNFHSCRTIAFSGA
jgi:hypothetical protein